MHAAGLAPTGTGETVGPGDTVCWSSVLLLAACAFACLTGCDGSAPAPAPAQPHIVLITLESLRPDHVGSYSGERETTPNLDALAREAVVYEDAHSVTSWTLASHASLFTGLYPTAHGATEPMSRLDDSVSTLAELLHAHGYQTAGVASGPYLTRQHNLHQGFEVYDDSAVMFRSVGKAHGDVTNPMLEAILGRFLESQRDPARPLFLFAYYWDPHYDYIPPAPYDTMFVDEECEQIGVRNYESGGLVDRNIRPGELRYVLSQYDGEIRWTDDHLGRLFEALRRAGLWDDAVIIVTSDHGEEFFDHGEKGHKRSLYSESVHVPLIVKYPRGEPRGRDSRLTSLVDLFPTILQLAGVSELPPHQGRSLLEAEPAPDRAILFELLSARYLLRDDGQGYAREDEEWIALRRGDEKLVSVPGQQRLELYDVQRDPGETLDLAIERPESIVTLMGLLSDLRQSSAQLGQGRQAAQAELSPQQREQLRALGYLEREAPAPAGDAE